MRPAEWHSGIAGRRRERTFAAIAAGEALVVAGARSALFLPFRDLGLIVVDEEHDSAYKQEDGVHYHARDMAVVRGQHRGRAGRAGLGDAVDRDAGSTPSRAATGTLQLPTRFGGRALPDIARHRHAHRAGRRAGAGCRRGSSPTVGETLARGEQALLFLNRRGYAPLTLCRACGHRFQCPNCTAWLVEHRFRRALVCHHCGHIERRPEACPECGAADSLMACGPGVERLAEEVARTLPGPRTLVLSSRLPRRHGAAAARARGRRAMARSTSSSARSSSPRATIFRS